MKFVRIKSSDPGVHVVDHSRLILRFPEIIEAKWESDAVKYGQKARLTIKMNDISPRCKIAVKVQSSHWDKVFPEERVLDVTESVVHYDVFPEVSFLKDECRDETESEMYAEVRLFSSGMALSPSALQEVQTTHGNVTTSKCKVKKNVIVIDPGHGTVEGNSPTEAGTQFQKYKYYVRGDNGEPTSATLVGSAEDLEDYILDNPSKWIMSRTGNDGNGKDNKAEWFYVVGVAEDLERLLLEAGYTVFLTRRNTESKTKITDYRKNMDERVNLVNDNKADYFISIHTNGLEDISASGYCVLYPRNEDKHVEDTNDLSFSRELGEDIFKYYTVVKKYRNPYQSGDSKRVLYNDNTALRRVIIELGFFSNPSDGKKLLENKALIAGQLFRGLDENIKKMK